VRATPRVLLTLIVLSAVGCGGGEGEEEGKVHTTDAGTVIVKATDDKTGLEVEVQNDSIYVHLAKDAPKAIRDMGGGPLGGACEVDGGGSVKVSRQFPIYWREDPGDWGSAVVRPLGQNGEGESLAQHVTSCRIFATKPTGVPDQVAFNEATDRPLATLKLRR